MHIIRVQYVVFRNCAEKILSCVSVVENGRLVAPIYGQCGDDDIVVNDYRLDTKNIFSSATLRDI